MVFFVHIIFAILLGQGNWCERSFAKPTVLVSCEKYAENDEIQKKHLKPQMVTDISDMTQGLNMLKAKRLDGLCGLQSVLNFNLEKEKNFLEKLVVSEIEGPVLEAVLCRRKSLPEGVKKLRERSAKGIKPLPNVF